MTKELGKITEQEKQKDIKEVAERMKCLVDKDLISWEENGKRFTLATFIFEDEMMVLCNAHDLTGKYKNAYTRKSISFEKDSLPFLSIGYDVIRPINIMIDDVSRQDVTQYVKYKTLTELLEYAKKKFATPDGIKDYDDLKAGDEVLIDKYLIIIVEDGADRK